MNPSPRLFRLLASPVLLTGTLLISACSSLPQRAPLYQNAGFDPGAVTAIAILPGADLRTDKTVLPNASEKVAHTARLCLKARHYQFVEVAATGYLPPNVTESDLEKPPAEWVKALPSASSRWVLVIAICDLRRNLTFGSTGNAEVSGYLYDKETGELVWHDKGVGRVGQGGLLGMAMVGAMASDALASACGNLFIAFPIRPEAK